MNIIRTPAKDFAISRFAADPEEWLTIVYTAVCDGDDARMQALYDQRAEAQLDFDKATPEWMVAEGNDDWSRYLAAGLSPLAAIEQPIFEPPAMTPPGIHIAWLRAALAEAGVLDDVNATVAAAGPVKQQLWDYATTITRYDTDVVAIADALSIDLDLIFARAAEIRDTRAA